jgi:hypothetical protein
MTQTESQNQKVLQYMERHGTITAKDAINFGCFRLSARIYDLKKRGHDIQTQIKRRDLMRWAEYSLKV